MRHIRLFVVLASLILLCRHGYAEPQPEQLLKAIIKIRAAIPETAYTARTLGTEREGHGVVIDATGLILTIGYLILEADTIEVVGVDDAVVRAAFVGYDHKSGFGLVRTLTPLEYPADAVGAIVNRPGRGTGPHRRLWRGRGRARSPDRGAA